MGKIASLFQFERRSLENPTTSLSDPAPWLFETFGGRQSATGLSITPENALESTTVWAAVRMISSTLATLPLPVYRHIEAGKERAREHPAYGLLHDRPNPEQSSFVWRETTAAHLLLYGNAYSEIERNGRGDPVALWPIFPGNVKVKRVGTQKVYVVRVDGVDVPIPAENMLHIPGFSLDGQNGLIPVHMAREAIGLSKATETYGASFFGNGAVPLTAISVPGNLTKEQEVKLRESFNNRHQGLSNAQRVALLSGGMEVSVLGIAPEHAQFLETRKFSVWSWPRLVDG